MLYPRVLGTSVATIFGAGIQKFTNEVLGTLGSTTNGIDIEFIDQLDNHKKYCQLKSGPNTINNDDVSTVAGHFKDRSLLPSSVADQLKPQFNAARQHLDSLEHNQLAGWAKRVRALPNGKALLPAPLKEAVWAKVSEALLSQKQLEATYLSRAKQKNTQLILHPIGLVSRYALSYLVA